jgi:hypothetical protein
LFVLAASCTPNPHDPVRLDSPAGQLDLIAWNFASQGPVIPLGWLWDSGVLWDPLSGRPSGLPDAQAFGAPDKGGSFSRTLGTAGAGGLAAATAWITISVDGLHGYALQIGAFPGAYRVWVNGVVVRQSGVPSLDPSLYRSGGAGNLVTVQPRDGVLKLVVEMVTNDPLARHLEMNRLWILGPAEPLLNADRAERNWRSLQVTVLAVGVLVFFWISRIRKERGALLVFVLFLLVCLLKLIANVEQPEPFLMAEFPGVPLSLYLFLNHGLNLLPFPLFVLFLNRQFPEDISFRSFVVVLAVTLAAEVWELLPFVLLALGAGDLYEAVLGLSWALVLNLYVVAVVLFIFERFYHLHHRRRPLSSALFYGGMVLGIVILVPIPLSFFMPVKYTYFLGWGLFFYLMVVCFDLVRLQIRTTESQVAALTQEIERRGVYRKLVAPSWASWLGRPALEDVKAGDRRTAEVVVIAIGPGPSPEDWLALVGPAAAARHAALVDWREGCGLWVTEAWSEAALALALEVQRLFTAAGLTGHTLALCRATVEFRLYDANPLWQPVVEGLPFERLAELRALAEKSGTAVILDASLQDGLVIGGWRRHRHLSATGREIELYEAEEETLAVLKDQTLDSFEEGLALARAGRFTDAVQALFAVVRHNPFDQAAKVLLNEWQNAKDS